MYKSFYKYNMWHIILKQISILLINRLYIISRLRLHNSLIASQVILAKMRYIIQKAFKIFNWWLKSLKVAKIIDVIKSDIQHSSETLKVFLKKRTQKDLLNFPKAISHNGFLLNICSNNLKFSWNSSYRKFPISCDGLMWQDVFDLIFPEKQCTSLCSLPTQRAAKFL